MSDSKNTSKRVRRDVLPIPDQPYSGFVAYDAKDPDSKFAPIEELRPPQGAPNVLIVLLDDLGLYFYIDLPRILSCAIGKKIGDLKRGKSLNAEGFDMGERTATRIPAGGRRKSAP